MRQAEQKQPKRYCKWSFRLYFLIFHASSKFVYNNSVLYSEQCLKRRVRGEARRFIPYRARRKPRDRKGIYTIWLPCVLLCYFFFVIILHLVSTLRHLTSRDFYWEVLLRGIKCFLPKMTLYRDFIWYISLSHFVAIPVYPLNYK